MIRSRHRAGDADLCVCTQGEGMPFVFQHGLCGDAAQPAHVFPDDCGYRCVTIECRGHGQSRPGAPEALSIQTFADDIADYIEASNLDRPVIGGISMGAAIAMRVAIRRPELVRALVIARPAWLADKAPETMYPNLLAGELLRDFEPQEALRRFEASQTASRLAGQAPDNLASVRGFFCREPIAVTSALLTRISLDGPGVTEDEIARIGMPTLVIGHRKDAVHPLAYATKIAGWIANARFVEITPKAEDAQAYRRDFQSALACFLREI